MTKENKWRNTTKEFKEYEKKYLENKLKIKKNRLLTKTIKSKQKNTLI